MKSRATAYISVLFVLTFGCATTDFLGNFNLVSEEEELELGREMAESVAKEYKVSNDSYVNNYIQSIGQKLVSVSQTPEHPYEFRVLETDQVNAFAIPGWKLYVMTGLIDFADNEAQLAAVMAHEIGHAEERHPTEQLSRAMGTQTLLGLVLGDQSGAITKQMVSVLAAGGISAYSRSAEHEADKIAVYLLNRAGYDPNALVTFFEKLVALEQQSGGQSGASLFATHPPTPDRIQAAKQIIASFGAQKQNATSLIGNFNQLKSRIR